MQSGLRRLHYFNKLAEELNFRRTADKLGITQPALSRAIALLELDVGTQLLERSNRNVKLTAAGESFLGGSQRVITALDGAVGQACRVAQGQAGHITIGYTDTAITGRLPDYIRSLRQSLPDVTIHLKQAYSQQQSDWLDDGILDIAFMTGPSEREGQTSLAFQIDQYTAILPAEHILANKPLLRLQDLADCDFILGDPIHWQVYNTQFFKLCRASGFTPRVVQSAPDSRGITGMVACGMGVSVQTQSLVRGADTRICFKDLHGCKATIVTEAVWNTRITQPVRDTIVEHLQGWLAKSVTVD